jgi:menaquinone-dependent protoporphyrinogen IX oxidase
MWYVQLTAIILFCAWTPAMIVYSIVKLSSLRKSERERLARISDHFERHRPEAVPDAFRVLGEPADEAPEEPRTQSWVDADIVESPWSSTMPLVLLGALWFFPAFFLLCVFLFAGIR